MDQVRQHPPSVVLIPVPRADHRKKIAEWNHPDTTSHAARKVMNDYFTQVVSDFQDKWNDAAVDRGFVVRVVDRVKSTQPVVGVSKRTNRGQSSLQTSL